MMLSVSLIGNLRVSNTSFVMMSHDKVYCFPYETKEDILLVQWPITWGICCVVSYILLK